MLVILNGGGLFFLSILPLGSSGRFAVGCCELEAFWFSVWSNSLAFVPFGRLPTSLDSFLFCLVLQFGLSRVSSDLVRFRSLCGSSGCSGLSTLYLLLFGIWSSQLRNDRTLEFISDSLTVCFGGGLESEFGTSVSSARSDWSLSRRIC